MGVAAGAGRKPDRDHEPAVLELNAVCRAGCQHFPIILVAKLLKRRRDLHRLREGQSIVVSALIKAAHVFEAEQEMNHASLGIGDRDGIVVRDVPFVRELLSQGPDFWHVDPRLRRP